VTPGSGENDPTWVLVWERDGSREEVGASYPVDRSGWGIRLETGADASSAPRSTVRDGVVVMLDGFLFDQDRARERIPGAASAADDLSLLLASYRTLGEEMLTLLRGSFVLAVWDSVRGSLLCARDPSGSHPALFAHVGGRVLLAASQAALVAVAEVPGDLDRLTIARWIALADCLPRRTFYAKVERLPPGHLLRAEAGGVTIRRFWRPDLATAYDLTPDEAETRFRRLLEQAVRRCASLGPVGVFLSGGADSAAVAAAATSVSRSERLSDPVALSYVMPHPNANEQATQELVARSLGIPQYLVSLDTALAPEGLVASGLALSAKRPFPCVNPWEPIWAHLAAEGARRGCRVVIGGEGGNPWFDLEEAEAADAIRKLRPGELRRMWTEERRFWSRRVVAESLLWSAGARLLLREVALRVLTPRLIRTLRARDARRRLPSDWVPRDASLRESLVEEWVSRDPLSRQGSFREWGRMDKLESASLTAALKAENHHAVGRALGVSFLDPPVDPDLVEFLGSLPGRLINLNGEWKGLARAVVRSIAGSASDGALGHAWTHAFLTLRMEREAPAALAGLGGLPHLSELSIVDEKRFADAHGGNELAPATRYYQLWRALACEAWLQGHC
jgi:hypothetical protein